MKYIFISDIDVRQRIPEKNGVYIIYSLNKKHKPNHIQRVLGKDPKGIIYIGSAPKQKLRVRLNNFRLCVLPQYKTTNHSGGKRYKRLKSFQKKFPISTLAFTYIVTKVAKKTEKKMLEDYCQKFGEVPPLNNSN